MGWIRSSDDVTEYSYAVFQENVKMKGAKR